MRVQKLLALALDVLILIVLFIFIKYGIALSISSWKRSFQTLKLSYSYVTMALPVMSVLMLVSVGIDIGNLMKQFNDAAPEKNK